VPLVKEMADAICKARGALPVGTSWPYSFITRTPELSTMLGRVYECQRKQCEDPVVIEAWFRLVQNTVNKHGIVDDDKYNFDECGFQMGQISASKVVTSTERDGRPKQIKPTNTEWVTLIQGASAKSFLVPPFFVFKGKEYNLAWFADLPSTWTFTLSDNGWTTNKIGIQWIEHFEKHTRARTVGSKRLLVLDNHGSHTTPEFRDFCEEHNIILLWMPPHSSHLLQPMDVGCFGPLKQAFSKQNQSLIRKQIFHVTKLDFIASIHAAINTSLTANNIQAGFRDAGLFPLNPDAVLSRLDPLPQDDTPPCSQGSWQPRTPCNTTEVGQQATLIQQRFQKHQNSSPAPIYKALNQLSKGAQVMAATTKLLQSQILDLRQANKVLQVRRTKKRKALQSYHAISISEAQCIVVAQAAVVETQRMETVPRPLRQAPTCSRCKTQGHTVRTCRAVGYNVCFNLKLVYTVAVEMFEYEQSRDEIYDHAPKMTTPPTLTLADRYLGDPGVYSLIKTVPDGLKRKPDERDLCKSIPSSAP